MTHFRQTAILAAIAAALIAGATTANAQTTVITREPVQTQTIVTEQPLQRQTIYRTIVRERVRPAQPTVEYRVGMRVPPTAQIYTVPETIAVEVPAIKTYKYMMVNNRVVLIDPATSQVVDEIID